MLVVQILLMKPLVLDLAFQDNKTEENRLDWLQYNVLPLAPFQKV